MISQLTEVTPYDEGSECVEILQELQQGLKQGKDVVVQAPTGSGKTYIFELLYLNLKQQAVFTVPTRALANDKLSEWRARGWDVGISTGDIALNLDARVVVATLETQRGRFLRGEGPGLLVLRGQGGEEIVFAAIAADGGSSVRGSSMLFGQQLNRFFRTLPPAATQGAA